MYFDDWSSFLKMGGHGLYVWSAYGVALLVMTYNLLAPARAKRQVRTLVLKRELMERQIRTEGQSLADHSQVISDITHPGISEHPELQRKTTYNELNNQANNHESNGHNKTKLRNRK